MPVAAQANFRSSFWSAAASLLLLTGCEYTGLLRPSVLSQLDPPV
jgi:hypothetical protein